MQIILASQSLQRKKVLESMDLDFKVEPADIDELAVKIFDPKKRAKVLAKMKGEVIEKKYSDKKDVIIISADTYGVLNGVVLEKPRTLKEAEEMLAAQSGKTAISYTGFYYSHLSKGIFFNEVSETIRKFRNFSKAEIKKYVNNNPVLTWSAAFCAAYVEGAALIESMEGALIGLTHGLPTQFLIPCLKKSGVIK